MNLDRIEEASSSIANLSSATRMLKNATSTNQPKSRKNLDIALPIMKHFPPPSILFQVGGMGRQPGKFCWAFDKKITKSGRVAEGRRAHFWVAAEGRHLYLSKT